MNELITFLRARFAEDAEAAQDATAGLWAAEHPEAPWGADPEARIVGGGKILGSLSNDYNGHLNADHIARHDPARVLAEVAAKRHFLDDLLPDLIQADRLIEGEWNDNDDLSGRALRLLAQPYADHPDYREEWKP